MKRIFFCLILIFISCLTLSAADLTKYVNPFIGTGGHGHTYPGASMPYGMVQLSPDTRLSGWDGCSAYHHSDSLIYGFSHTHLSGTGCSDYGDILLMPASDEKIFGPNDFVSHFSHKNEKASPGYYSVYLDDHKIQAEFTVSKRAGFHKYSFSSKSNKRLLLDLKHRDEVIDSKVNIKEPGLITGYRRSRAWATDQIVYFAIRFSEPSLKNRIFNKGEEIKNSASVNSKNLKVIFEFGNESSVLYVKAGISAVSEEGALANLDNEISDWNFEKIKSKANEEWNKELSKILVDGGTEKNKTVFYTSLYHSMLSPNLYMDVDGSYRGRDNKIHKADGFDYYTVFSLWDTYRAEHPLLTIIDRKRSTDFINTFLMQYRQGKLLPVWELSANETFCMIGYHAVPVIADAMMKGIGGFDKELALEACIKSAEMDHFGLKSYKKNNCVLMEDENESVSKTLEYAYDDWCIAQMAKLLGKDSVYNVFINRALSYRNLFDSETGFMRARYNGGWYKPFDPTEVNNNYTEANCWQYTFYVPQDISGLMDLLGGKSKLESKLDELFNSSSKMTGREQSDITGLIGQYAHGNEPSHHIAYLYNYCSVPWKTQSLVRKIMDELYTDQIDGLSGNEDCGQMSAWYVLSAMGFYPVCPGSNHYALGTPLFNNITINQENGKTFKIKAIRESENSIFIKTAKLNGSDYNKSYFTNDDLLNGSELTFDMADKAEKTFASDDISSPVTKTDNKQFVNMPVIEAAKRSFRGSTDIVLKGNNELYYSFDKLNWINYKNPLTIDKSVRIYAKNVNNKFESNIAEAAFYKLNDKLSIDIKSKVNRQYTAGGPEALIDGIRGKENFRIGDWQGYVDTDFEAVINLGEDKIVKELIFGTLQDVGAWIIFPKFVEISFSEDGMNFSPAERLMNRYPETDYKPVIKDFKFTVNKKCRFIKVFAKNYGDLPIWHAGAGGKSFIFTDEIIIN